MVGSTVGLYGGSGRTNVCDPNQLVSFLAQHPDRARAWAGVEGIGPAEISGYVRTLTPVLLRTDTLVDNHGFLSGHATAYQAVLEAGTAVLVDEFGVPRVKCSCGNPLTETGLTSSISYTGPSWADFNTARVVVIVRSTTIIRVLTLVDVANGRRIAKRAGSGTPPVAPSPPPRAAGGGARVGQTLTVRAYDAHSDPSTFKITLLKVVDPQPAGTSSVISPGHHFLGAFLRITNIGPRVISGSPVTVVSNADTYLVTTRQPVVDEGPAAGTGQCTDTSPLYRSSPLAPGATATGCWSFALGSGERARTLVVGDGRWSLP
jgi:hypothetical protein